MTETLIVAHCGDSKHAPESTIPAFQSAIEKGVNAIEFDVHLTRDGKLIIHHDNYLGRTEQASGFIGDYTLAELQSLDVGVWFDRKFEGTRMPTLEDVFALRNGTIRFEIELRTPSLLCLQAVTDEIASAKLEEQVELTSPHVPLLCRVKTVNPNLRTGLFFEPFRDWVQTAQREELVTSWLVLSGAEVGHLPLATVDNSLVCRAHDLGLLIHGANLNTKNEIQSGLEMQIDQYSTDDLELALSLRRYAAEH
jgi:glycerophosphoryl diester phosphodiesterase